MASMCETCQGLQKHLQVFEERDQADRLAATQWVNTTLPSLRRSSANCRACALLVQAILLHHSRFSGADEESVGVVVESFESSTVEIAQDHLSIEVRWKSASNGVDVQDEIKESYPDLKLEIFTDQNEHSPYSAIGPGRHIAETFLDDAGVKASRDLINECLTNHARCRHVKPHVQPATLPKRVLDVLIDDPSKGVRLHESQYDEVEEHYEYGEYLALSYCRGIGRGIPQTTSKTLKAYKQGIPWASFPRAFQEAILLTRSRGFRWLWIDSLCIIQDDPLERIAEAMNMGEIFGNAFVTLAATSSVDTSQGLFPPRDPPFRLQTSDISRGSPSKVYVREQPLHYSFKTSFDPCTQITDWELPLNTSRESDVQTPLLRRAWTYAERLLSPRVLHFTRSEMILECSEGYQCECHRIENPTYDPRATDPIKQLFARIADATKKAAKSNDEQMDGVTSQLADTSITETRSQKREEALQIWTYIVTEYTNKRITYDADRLLAIAAVAKTFSKFLDSGYIAGQWTCSTINLLWYPNDSTHCRRPKRIPSRNIPSWSWASIEGSPILFDTASAMDLACSASFSSKPHDRRSAWSPLSGDKLRLTASMATDVSFRADSNTEYSLVRNGVSVEFRPDVVPPRGADAMDSGEKLVCVLVCMTFRSSIVGIVLKESKSHPQVYRRVGRFECYEVHVDEKEAEPEDAEALFSYWFPEVKDMMQLDEGPMRTYVVV
ncbi:HET-domain-containing protein [Periconia macrospinosa]|uniref:HET-domain-containing protein n=1 Tax=Periconia macrospinosa TaxID=97972 RepID=A0A2V1EAI3_9PLEO|nr:HET-domain-containing protein [Periconia macrospinosa]